MTNKKYWRVVCRYGHIGGHKEVSVARYLETNSDCHLVDVLEIVSKMPGVKRGNNLLNPITKAESISQEVYKEGIKEEEKNIFLQRLRTFHYFLKEHT